MHMNNRVSKGTRLSRPYQLAISGWAATPHHLWSTPVLSRILGLSENEGY
jgi:hypothetical protein